MSTVKIQPFDELSKYVQEASTPSNLLQDTPDYDAIKQEEYENFANNTADTNDEESDD